MTSGDREQAARDYVSYCNLQGGWIDETIDAKNRADAELEPSARVLTANHAESLPRCRSSTLQSSLRVLCSLPLTGPHRSTRFLLF